MHDSFDLDSETIADSWATSVNDDLARSRLLAWVVAAIAAAIAFLEAVAIVMLLPLKTIEPYTLLVDRQTGHVEALAPLERETISPDAALTRSFLVQYVIARESYDFDNLQTDYRRVALWTQGDERQRYIALMQGSSPSNPVAAYPRDTRIVVEVKSVSSVSANTSLVRFQTTRIDRGGVPQDQQHWASLVTYTFTGAEMSEADRLVNPLGFQVSRYRRDAEVLPENLPPQPAAQVQGAPRGERTQ